MEVPSARLFYTNREGLVEVSDDVQSIVRQVREITNGRIKVHIDEQSGEYFLVEYCEDQTERLVFTTPTLDARVITRLLNADSQTRGHEDPYDVAEREQDKLLREADERTMDGIRDAGERLAWAMEEDGKGTHASILVTRNLAHS